MKHYIKKSALFFICLVLLLQSFAVLASAKQSYVDWEISEDGNTLTGNGKVYERCNVGFTMSPVYYYQFRDTVVIPDREGHYKNGECPVRSLGHDSDVVWVKMKSSSRIFVATEKEREHFERYKNGEEQTFNLNEYHDNIDAFSYLDGEFVTRLDSLCQNGAKTLTIDASELESATFYYIVARDTYLILLYNYGIVFKLDDGYYYANYATLGNSNLDDDGNFSYQSGSVTLARVEGDLDAKLEERICSLQRTYGPTVEFERGGGLNIDFSFELPFWPTYIIYSFVLPYILVILGVCFANSKKFKNAKYFYILCAVGGVWIFIAFMRTLLLI